MVRYLLPFQELFVEYGPPLFSVCFFCCMMLNEFMYDAHTSSLSTNTFISISFEITVCLHTHTHSYLSPTLFFPSYIGFGLPHTDENPHNENLGNCLDYTDSPTSNMLPGEVNMAKLRDLYLTQRRRRVESDGTVVITRYTYLR